MTAGPKIYRRETHWLASLLWVLSVSTSFVIFLQIEKPNTPVGPASLWVYPWKHLEGWPCHLHFMWEVQQRRVGHTGQACVAAHCQSWQTGRQAGPTALFSEPQLETVSLKHARVNRPQMSIWSSVTLSRFSFPWAKGIDKTMEH